MKRCKENCSICPYVNSCKSVKSTYTDNIVPLNKEFDCLTQNLVYLVHCKKCNDQYVGETKNTLRKRFSQHLGYVDSKDFRQATGRHFHLPGHQKSHMSITVLEKLYTDDTAYRKRRESHYIELFNRKYTQRNEQKEMIVLITNKNFYVHLSSPTIFKNFIYYCYDQGPLQLTKSVKFSFFPKQGRGV